jgi:putative ABC transport system permease protein
LTLLKLVIKELWRRRWRLVASVLALVLASGLIIAILSLNSSSRQAMHGYLKNLGANMVVIPATLDLVSYYSADPVLLSRDTMPESHFFRLIEAGLKGLEGIDPRLVVPVEIGGNRALLTGILPGRMLRPKASRIVVEDPWEKLKLLSPDTNSAILGTEIAEIVSGQTGSIVQAGGRELSVLGVLPPQGTLDDLRIYVHLRSLQRWVQKPLSLSEIRILHTDAGALEVAASRIEGSLENTRVVTNRRMARKQIHIMGSIRRYALALLAVILVLGCIIIGNEMFHNAHERRREIGILTAMGATTRAIVWIFMMKAVFLALIGGLVGYGTGTAAALLVAPRFLQIQISPSLHLIPLAILVAVGLSVLSSLVPAWRASRMDPATIIQEV